MIDTFKQYLKGTNLSENTQESYLFAVKQYQRRYQDKITKSNLRDYKVWLIENFNPKTVNLRLRGINALLESLGKEQWKISFVKVQQKPFLENVISEADYKYFKNRLKKDGEMSWYFVIRFLAATGARVSELVQFKVEHVKVGYFDLYAKGGKLRRIYIPKALQKEALSWLTLMHRESGFLFLNKYGEFISPINISILADHPNKGMSIQQSYGVLDIHIIGHILANFTDDTNKSSIVIPATFTRHRKGYIKFFK